MVVAYPIFTQKVLREKRLAIRAGDVFGGYILQLFFRFLFKNVA
jgi:hypothetical protein